MEDEAVCHATRGAYEIEKVHAIGGTSRVYLAKHVMSRQNCVIKSTMKSNDALIENIRNEISLLNDIKCPFIVKPLEVGENEHTIWFAMEYLPGGSLREFIAARGRLEEAHAQNLFHEIVFAVKYLHDVKGILHRDLKTENILIDGNQNIRLIDFGLSCKLRNGENAARRCGSVLFTAPEMVVGNPYDFAVDVWSLGICLYMSVTGWHPFIYRNDDAINVEKIFDRVVKCDLMQRPMSPECWDLISRILVAEPSARLTLQQILQHPWMTNSHFSGKMMIVGERIMREYRWHSCGEEMAGDEDEKEPENWYGRLLQIQRSSNNIRNFIGHLGPKTGPAISVSLSMNRAFPPLRQGIDSSRRVLTAARSFRVQMAVPIMQRRRFLRATGGLTI